MRTLTFHAPGRTPLVVGGPGDDLELLSLDLGVPVPRRVIDAAVDADGEIDTTAHFGGRTVTVAVYSSSGDWEMLQRLRAFLSPRLRPTIVLVEPGAPDRQITVRGEEWDEPVPAEHVHAGHRFAVSQWFAPSGVIESAVEYLDVVYPGSTGGAGVELPVELPVELVGSGPPGSGTVVNGGTIDAFPVLRLFGPLAAGQLVVENRTTGRRLVFDDLEVTGGNYVEVDVRRRTILLNGLLSQSRYDRLVVAESQWWTLAPGVNDVRFLPDSFTAPAQMQVRHRWAWI